MKLRTRLFIWIGSLFFLFAVISYLIESFLVYKHLQESEKSTRVEIKRQEEEVRSHFESFLGIVLADFQAEINAILYRLQEFSYLKAKFIKSKGFQSWSPSSLLLLENKWLGFIQNTFKKKLSSLLIPDPFAIDACEKKIIDDDLAWIHFHEESPDKTYIGIRISSDEVKQVTPSLVDYEVKQQPDEYYFYNPKKLLELNFDSRTSYSSKEALSEEEIAQMQSYKALFLKKIVKAKIYLKKYFEENPSSFEKFPDQPEPAIFPPSFFKRLDPSLSDIILNEFNEALVESVNQDLVVRMMWKISSLLYLDLFGASPLDFNAPIGIAMIFNDKKVGNGVYSSAVFSENKIFDDSSYFFKNKPAKNFPIPSSVALVTEPNNDRLFLANSLEYDQDSFLSLGIDISDLLQRLSLASNQFALLAHNNKVVTVYGPQGIHLKKSAFYNINPNQLLQKEGFIEVGKQNYYYLKLEPYEESDLHFYILELESKAFSFVNFIIKEMKDLIENVTFSLRLIGLIALIIALIFLHNIAKKVSNPISKLAKLTEPIAAGHFDQVNIPDIHLGHSKEVKLLCSAFGEMVKGLKDKEKVRGVLNKVVSKQIAEEILKGSVQLGGEEKSVTILFADIRQFTKMTENMKPHEVIDLLNATMTKLSQIVDLSGGVIDKFVGDEVMALFGAPIEKKDHILRSLVAAYLMRQKIKEWNDERQKQNQVKIDIGIGIHTGLVVAGNMGAENRLNYTVLGSNVNMAARMCSIAEPNEILVTEKTLENLDMKDKIQTKKKEPVKLKGFTEEVICYSIIDMPQDLIHTVIENAKL
jgi:class 3 adenylate cyclase/HAMP domain-containing protein